MNKTSIIILIVIVVVAAGIWLLLGQRKPSVPSAADSTTAINDSLNQIDLLDINSQFKEIDADINNL